MWTDKSWRGTRKKLIFSLLILLSRYNCTIYESMSFVFGSMSSSVFYDDDDDGYATHHQQFNGIIQWATYCTRYTRMSYVTHTHTSAVNRTIRTKTNQTHWKVCRTKIYCVNWNCIHICIYVLVAIHILYVIQKATIHHNGHIVRTETHWCVMAKTPNEVDCWTICLSFPLLLSFVGCYRLLLCIFICAREL